MKIPGRLLQKRIVIENVQPSVDGGRYAAKRIAGEPCRVEADAFRDSHEVIRCQLKWRLEGKRAYRRVPMAPLGNDRWTAEFPLDEVGRYEFTVEAWTDHYASWLEDLHKRVEAGQERVSSEVAEGASLLREARERARGKDKTPLAEAAERLAGLGADPHAALAAASEPDLVARMATLGERTDLEEYAPRVAIVADRPRARFGAWYEIFVRSQGTDPARSGTFLDAERRLPEIRDMGMDVVYLTPIHPIGRTHRKGPNNTLSAGPRDPGSPWAIGNEHGGHRAIEPSLGTIEDFDRFVAAARRHDLEIALDFAIQASPDHPWVREHPEWFRHRPDGTIKYAENPPKKYQDIYPINFDNEDAAGLWIELRDTLLHWIEHGVEIFRVDNPHTKPFAFWEWVIAEIHRRHPGVIFLSEAFTRPKVMKTLAKLGFTQSYTYFTWRNTKWELTEYLEELAHTDSRDYFRPNFFVNTPDILHEVLQRGGRPAFKLRFLLAATLSPTYGIYGGFELCENEPVPGTEEYMNSEKFEIKPRDWNAPGNIKEYVALVNRLRRENPALQELSNVRFYETDNEAILSYGKVSADGASRLLVAANLDPFNPHHCTVRVPLDHLGMPAGSRFEMRDLLTGAVYEWGERNYVRLDPGVEPAHLLRVERVL